MARAWHRADPDFFEEVRRETLAAFPTLRFEIRSGHVWVAGPLPLVDATGMEVTRYEIAIRLPADFPDGVPDVFETGGRIDPFAEHHAYKSGRLCLWVSGERWRYWPKGSSLADFIGGAVRSHLLGHAHFEVTGEWPGARPHDAEGVFEAYSEMLGFSEPSVIIGFLRLLEHHNPKGHLTCPCGSGRRLRDCHRPLLQELRGKITQGEAHRALVDAGAHAQPCGGGKP